MLSFSSMIENKNIVEMRPKLHHFYAFTHFTLHLGILIHIFFSIPDYAVNRRKLGFQFYYCRKAVYGLI